jgi:hypothetical protein
MPYFADIAKCEQEETKHHWVSKAPELGSKECVASVKALTGAPQTILWRRGKKVKGNNIFPGTAIATFLKKNNTTNLYSFEGHSAIFRRYTEEGIEIYDQYPSPPKRFGKRTIPYNTCGAVYAGNNAEAFYVIDAVQDPSEDTGCTI